MSKIQHEQWLYVGTHPPVIWTSKTHIYCQLYFLLHIYLQFYFRSLTGLYICGLTCRCLYKNIWSWH